jgi:hypothetical protein
MTWRLWLPERRRRHCVAVTGDGSGGRGRPDPTSLVAGTPRAERELRGLRAGGRDCLVLGRLASRCPAPSPEVRAPGQGSGRGVAAVAEVDEDEEAEERLLKDSRTRGVRGSGHATGFGVRIPFTDCRRSSCRSKASIRANGVQEETLSLPRSGGGSWPVIFSERARRPLSSHQSGTTTGCSASWARTGHWAKGNVTRMTWREVSSPCKFYQRHQFFGQIRIYLVHSDFPRCPLQWCPAWCPPAGDMSLVLQNRGCFGFVLFCLITACSVCA